MRLGRTIAHTTHLAVTVGLTAGLVVGSALNGAALNTTPKPHQRDGVTHPNIVLFMVDDATVEDIEYMPTVQTRLADAGVTFARNYSPNALCCPARATVLSGKYSHNTGVVDNKGPHGGIDAFDPTSTIATWLDPDYRTGLIGKYLNGYDETYPVPPGWDTWKSVVSPTVSKYYGWHLATRGGDIINAGGEYSTRFAGQEAREFIDSPSPDPFFAYVAFNAPHNGTPHEPGDPGMGSPTVQAAYRDTYAGPSLPSGAGFDEPDISDKRASYQNTPPLTATQIAEIPEVLAQRREALASVDDQIAATMNQVDAAGQGDNTYYLFMSDNGWMQGQHRQPSSKGVPWEAAARVPLIIAGPGLPAGVTVDQVSGLQDVAPTIADMAGVTHPAVDGISLLDLAGGATSSRAQLIEIAVTTYMPEQFHLAHGEALQTITWAARGIVTTDGWKYVTYPQTGEIELYDLNTDPYELSNLGRDPAYNQIQATLADRLHELKTCAGSGCRVAS